MPTGPEGGEGIAGEVRGGVDGESPGKLMVRDQHRRG
jgi:hypothetical protein